MSRSAEYVIDLDRVETFAMRAARPRIDDGAGSPENNESGNCYTDLLALKQNVQIPELKNLFDIVSNPANPNLLPAEKETFFRSLMPKLKLTYERNAGKRYRLTPYNEDFPNRFASTSTDPELSKFLTSIKALLRTKFDPATAVASAALDLLDPAKTNEDIRTNILTNLAEHKEERFNQANLDVPRNGIRVRRGEEVLEFREVEAFRAWGSANGLTGEQIDFTTCFAHQGILYAGSISPAFFHQDKSLYPEGSSLTSSFDPTITLDITELGKVSIFSQDKISGIHRDNLLIQPAVKDYDLVISTYSSDISALRGEEFIPGLASSRVSFDVRITTPDISKFGLLVPDAILAEPDPSRTSNLELFARNKIRGTLSTSTKEIASVLEDRLPILRPRLSSLRSEDSRFRDDTRISVLASGAAQRELAEAQRNLASEDRNIEGLRSIADTRKNLLKIANGLSETEAKEALLRARDDIFDRAIVARPGLFDQFIEIERGKIETLSEAIQTIQLAPENLRDRYKERFREPYEFAAFCVQAVTKEVTENPTLSHDKIMDISKKLLDFNEILDSKRGVNPESLIRKIASSKNVVVEGSYISAGAVVGGFAGALNFIGGDSTPEDIFLGNTGMVTSIARSLGRGALSTIGYRAPSSTSPDLEKDGFTRLAAASVSSAVGTPPKPPSPQPGIVGRLGALLRRNTPSPPTPVASAEQSAVSPSDISASEIASTPRSRAVRAGIPETRPRAGSSSAELAQLADIAAREIASHSPESPVAFAAAARDSLARASSPPRGRGRSSAFLEKELHAIPKGRGSRASSGSSAGSGRRV